nr:MAG TPA: hypothetical protein [Caudoviricetes sp.]
MTSLALADVDQDQQFTNGFSAECIAIGPLYFVAQLRVSYFFTPQAISDAHGCHIVIAFILLLQMSN